MLLTTGCGSTTFEISDNANQTSSNIILEETEVTDSQSSTDIEVTEAVDYDNNDKTQEDDEMYILILETIRCASDSDVAGDLTIVAAEEDSNGAGHCNIGGRNADKVKVDVNEKEKKITIKCSQYISPNSITIDVSGGIREIRADKCKLNIDVDLGKTQNAALTLKGTFYGDVKLATETTSIDVNGAGDFGVSGTARDFQVSLDGAAVLDTTQLLAENVDVTVRGSSICEVYASKYLNAALYGVGSITYYGNPETVEKSVKGLGVIEPN